MSTIGSDPHLNLTGLGGLGGQGALDELQARQQQRPQSADALRETARADTGATPVDVDAGELVLQADAWEGSAAGTRLLSGDPGFESTLGHLDLSAAADLAVDTIFAEIDAHA